MADVHSTSFPSFENLSSPSTMQATVPVFSVMDADKDISVATSVGASFKGSWMSNSQGGLLISAGFHSSSPESHYI